MRYFDECEFDCPHDCQPGKLHTNQGILIVPEIADYKWVPARIGHFYKDKIFFVIPTAN